MNNGVKCYERNYSMRRVTTVLILSFVPCNIWCILFVRCLVEGSSWFLRKCIRTAMAGELCQSSWYLSRLYDLPECLSPKWCSRRKLNLGSKQRPIANKVESVGPSESLIETDTADGLRGEIEATERVARCPLGFFAESLTQEMTAVLPKGKDFYREH